MWVCKTCKREFKNIEQDHFCSKAPNTVDAYIAAQAEAVQPRLKDLRAMLQNILPDAVEKISWQMPTYWKKRNLIHFAAFKNHIGIYPGAEAMVHFAGRSSEYKTSKGAVQFPHTKPLPLDLIAEIARWCRTKQEE
jgi:Uncharacterized conserved protein